MQVFFGIAYFVVGIVQLFAIADGIDSGLGISGFFGFVIALFITYIPLIGSAVGVYGAANAWDWPIWQAVLLFFWYVPVAILVASVGTFASR